MVIKSPRVTPGSSADHESARRVPTSLLLLRWAFILLCALVAAGSVWAAQSVFLPVARTNTSTSYILVSASSRRFLLDLALVIAAILGWQAFAMYRWRPPFSLRAWARLDHCRHLSPLLLLGLSLVPAINLSTPQGHWWASWSYVLVDLRWWWWGLVVLWVVHRARPAGLGRWWREGQECSEYWAEASLVAAAIAIACVSTPHTRFQPDLVGDEPKYVRYCENLYQGLGFDMAAIKQLDELPPDFEPRALENLRTLGAVVGEEARSLVADGQALLGGRREFNRARYLGWWFLEGKRPGTLYQVHTPGLGLILFPAYYLDRRVLADQWTGDGRFPVPQYMLNVALLTLFGLYTLVVFRLLRTHAGRRLAWVLTFISMIAMPVGAFAFQFYPEIAAGVLLVSGVLYLLSNRRPAGMALMCGIGVGFLPWLHIRFSLAVVVILGWSLFQWRRHPRATALFAAGAIAALVTFCLYVYRVTGSLLPSGLYDVRGEYFNIRGTLAGWRILTFDSTWGLLPHAPIYALSLLGMGLTWRRKPATAGLVTLVLLSLAMSAGHDPMAGGTTPVRYLVAGLPLLMVFLADAALHWQRNRTFTAAFIILAMVSLDTGLAYNLHHKKDASQLIAGGFAGFRPNLLFPGVANADWMPLPWAFVVVGFLTCVLVWLLGAGVWTSRRQRWRDGAAREALDQWALRPSAGFIAAGLAVLAAAGTAVSAASGEWVRPAYLAKPNEVRERALLSFQAQGRCTACAATGFGEVNPVEVVGLDTTAFTAQLDAGPGSDLAYVVRGKAMRGQAERGWGTFNVDFGDGVVERDTRVFGESLVEHTYKKPGLYVVRTSFEARDGIRFNDERVLNVRGRPEKGTTPPAFDDIEGLPETLRGRRRTAAVTDVLVGGDGIDLRHDALTRWPGHEIWLVTHTGSTWRARAPDAPWNPPPAGVLVGAFAVAGGQGPAERTGLVIFHWPAVEVVSRAGPVRVELVSRERP
jgi:hypothetical protein